MTTAVRYPENHSYRKDAKAFIKGLAKRQEYIQQTRSLLQPICEKYGVRDDWSVPQELWSSYEWKMSNVKRQVDEISGKHIRLNRRLEKLKYAFWAINPNGTEEYYKITNRN